MEAAVGERLVDDLAHALDAHERDVRVQLLQRRADGGGHGARIAGRTDHQVRFREGRPVHGGPGRLVRTAIARVGDDADDVRLEPVPQRESLAQRVIAAEQLTRERLVDHHDRVVRFRGRVQPAADEADAHGREVVGRGAALLHEGRLRLAPDRADLREVIAELAHGDHAGHGGATDRRVGLQPSLQPLHERPHRDPVRIA